MEQEQHHSNKDDRLGWYQEAKFGLFIHWGVYSEAGVEASWPIMAPELSAAMFGNPAAINQTDYFTLPSRFNPVEFDPDAWVQLAKEAGMRYIVFTSKHHDGFCMFDAPGTDFKISNTPYGKDICLELAQACARHDMPLGFYYSPPDMHHPGYRDTGKPAIKNWTGQPNREEWSEYLDYMESHIRKLLTDYGEICVMWFDGLTNHGKYDPERFHKLVHELSPKTLINDRLGEDYDFITPEQFIPKEGIPALSGKPNPSMDPGGDGFFRLMSTLTRTPLIDNWVLNQAKKYSEGELELTKVHQEPFPSPERFQPWETCMTMGTSWAHNPNEEKWKSPGALIRNLVDVVSSGGNYLLNVGPTSKGTFPPEAIERLKYIGQWMQTNHKAIYAGQYTPLRGLPWGKATRKDNQLFLHVYDWPAAGKLVVEAFPGSVGQVSLMDGRKLEFHMEGTALEILTPAEPPDPEVSVLELQITPEEKGWNEHSAPVAATIEPRDYIKNSAKGSFIINAVLNGLIAFFSLLKSGPIPYADAAIDILITVFIIAFLTSWIVVGSARGEYRKGNIAKTAPSHPGVKLPNKPVLRALLITLFCVIVFGGVFMDGLLYLIFPVEMSNWAYIVIKTVYTGLSGALASALAILSVVWDVGRKSRSS